MDHPSNAEVRFYKLIPEQFTGKKRAEKIDKIPWRSSFEGNVQLVASAMTDAPETDFSLVIYPKQDPDKVEFLEPIPEKPTPVGGVQFRFHFQDEIYEPGSWVVEFRHLGKEIDRAILRAEAP